MISSFYCAVSQRTAGAAVRNVLTSFLAAMPLAAILRPNKTLKSVLLKTRINHKTGSATGRCLPDENQAIHQEIVSVENFSILLPMAPDSMAIGRRRHSCYLFKYFSKIGGGIVPDAVCNALNIQIRSPQQLCRFFYAINVFVLNRGFSALPEISDIIVTR